SKNSNGLTALLYAAINNKNPGVIDALIEAGAEDTRDNEGRNALMLAAQWNVPEVVDALIDAGADVKAKDKSGMTALDYAYNNKKLKDTLTLQRLERLSREA
ncbi:MAG: ankyrin repeat domain-containing protein, partial [Synergistaceae bacterium]|nr:ankyrin repeat domain-containing protein [Synergistaceae bacterium]